MHAFEISMALGVSSIGWIHEELWIGPLPKRSQEKATTILLCDDTHLADKPEKEPEREREESEASVAK